MIRKYEYRGHEYWVTVEPAIHAETKETVFIAYVSDTEPGGLLYGESIKEGGKTMCFINEHSALTNANAVKQSEIDSRQY